MALKKYHCQTWKDEKEREHWAKYHFEGSYQAAVPHEGKGEEFPDLIIDDYEINGKEAEPKEETYQYLEDNH